MWTDNVTDKDFLGFDVHANLIKELIKDEKMLPLTIGLFGDWGSGKSSILEVLKKDLEIEPKTACLYFNGWTFEGYDDAKAALLETIVKAFDDEKKFGAEIKDNLKKLYKSIKWMRIIGFGLKNIAIPFMTGGITQIAQGIKDIADDPEQFIDTSDKEDKFEVVRKFRDEFEKLLDKSKIDKLVVIIDDLDRCLPDRIIDNLEAIKLFLNVKNTAFVIGADPRIVRHAIEYRYKDMIDDSNKENSNERIVYDYLEKLIQIPYNLPKLSDYEVQTYITLLFCENDLENSNDFNKVLEAFKKFKEKDRYSVFDFVKVKEALADATTTEKLEKNVSLIAKLSPIISESLYGNPRQIKRFLNTFMLRKKLAGVAKISDFKDDILAKLMILEYAEPKLFEILYNWQMSNKGIAKPLGKLEEICCKKENEKISIPEDSKEWNKPKIINWITCEPFLSNIDLRDYYWISRDKLTSMQSNLLVSPLVKSLMTKLEPETMAEKLTLKILNDEVKVLSNNDTFIFFDLLKQRLITEPNKQRYYTLFILALENGFDCKSKFLETLNNIRTKIPPSAKESLKELAKTHSEFNQYIETKQKSKS
ncbi:ATPase [Bacteroidia bacterium]|nr:ATPase [Bacteroidia bacterium]